MKAVFPGLTGEAAFFMTKLCLKIFDFIILSPTVSSDTQSKCATAMEFKKYILLIYKFIYLIKQINKLWHSMHI